MSEKALAKKRQAASSAASQTEPPHPYPLAYDIDESCRRDGIGRSTKYKAISPDPAKRDGLPFLPSFTVGRRRLLLVADHQKWLEELRDASLGAEPSHQDA